MEAKKERLIKYKSEVEKETSSATRWVSVEFSGVIKAMGTYANGK